MFGEAAFQLSGVALKLIILPWSPILHPVLLTGNKKHVPLAVGWKKNTYYEQTNIYTKTSAP